MPIDKSRAAKWATAGYSKYMSSNWTCCPPPKEYVRVYHLTSAQHGLIAVALGRLKVARLHDLNDPFELTAVILRDKRTRSALKEYKSEYDRKNGLLCFKAPRTMTSFSSD
jgi:hypothetical protein